MFLLYMLQFQLVHTHSYINLLHIVKLPSLDKNTLLHDLFLILLNLRDYVMK